MIEFTLNRNKNGKKSRWAKKYPRKRILKRGSEKAAGWYFHNWHDDDYYYFHGDLHKFLLKNVGRPVDKVFSEFLQRCRRGTEKYNLRGWFYDMFKNKEDIDYTGGFYLSNGIINYKKRSKRPEGPYVPSVVLGLLPIANIILFAAFIIYYAIHAGWDPNKCDDYTHVFSLKGKNAITRCLLVIKNLLCRKV